jgi:phospholipase D1/2
MLATFLGMLPGLLVMTFFGNRLESAIRDPKAESFIILAALVVALVLVTAWLRRRFAEPDSCAATKSAPD